MAKPSKQHSIHDYLEKKEDDLVFIQGKIPRSLYKRLKPELNRLGVSWNKFLCAVSQRFIEEVHPHESSERLPSGAAKPSHRKTPSS